MTVNELRTLVDNLDEYIHVPGGIDRLKKTILQLAVSGQLVRQDPSEGTGEELYRQIQAEKAELIKQGKIKKQKALPEIGEDEIPFDVPESWRWTRVSELGYSLGQKVPDQDFYYVDVASIDNESQRLKQPSVLTAKDAPSRARKLVKKGTVIYSTVRPYLLNTTIIEGELDKELIASTAFAILHPFVGVDPRWLLSNLTSNYFTDYTNRKSVGMAYPAINDAQFSMAVMPLPPLAEQRRIVTKIEGIFTLIDQLAEAYKSEQAERSKLVASSLAQLAKGEVGASDSLALTHLSEIIRTKADAKILHQTILHLAVSGQLVPQDPSEGTGEELYQQIQAGLVGRGKAKKQKTLSEINEDEIPFEIPMSWTWIRLGGVIQVSSGNSLVKSQMTENGKYAVYGGNGVSGYYDDYMFEEQRVVVGRVGAQCGNVHITGRNSWVTDNAFVVNYPEKYIYREFITILLRFLDLKKTHKGSAQPVISGSSIYPVPIQLPPFAEQKRIVAKATQLFELVAELERYLEK